MRLAINQLPKILLISFFITSCGGGGSNTDAPADPQNPTQNNTDPFTAVTHVKSEPNVIGAGMYTQAIDNLGNITIVWNEVDHKNDDWRRNPDIVTSPYRLMATTYSAKTKKWSAKQQINLNMPNDVKPGEGEGYPKIKMNNGHTFISWSQTFFVKTNGNYTKAFVSRLDSHNNWTKPHYIRTGGSVNLAVNKKGVAIASWATNNNLTIEGFLSPNKSITHTITYQPVNAKWSQPTSFQNKFKLPTYLSSAYGIVSNLNSDVFYMRGILIQPTDDYDINNWNEDKFYDSYFSKNTFIRKYNGSTWGEPDLIVAPNTTDSGKDEKVAWKGFDAKGKPFFSYYDKNEVGHKDKHQLLKNINSKWTIKTLAPSFDPNGEYGGIGEAVYNKKNELLITTSDHIRHRNKNGWQKPKKILRDLYNTTKGHYTPQNAYLDDFGQIIVLLSRSSDSDPLNPAPQGLSGYPWPYIMLYTPSTGWSKPLRVPFERAAHAYPGIKNSPIHWPYIKEVKLLANEHGDSVITWITQRNSNYNIIQSIVMPIENWNKLK